MTFSSLSFLLYFLPPVLLLYHTVFRRSPMGQNILLLLASLLFYAWGDPAHVPVLVALALLDGGLGIWISRSEEKLRRQLLLIFGCTVHLGALVLYKHLDFLAEVFGMVFGSKPVVPAFVIPVGLSFFTLSALSYLLDVYRGRAQAGQLWQAGLYLLFFPKITSAPLLSYHEFESQLTERSCSWDSIAAGTCRFVVGLGKKLLLADFLADVSNIVYGQVLMGHLTVDVPVSLAWVGLAAWVLQLFLDLTAYTDMSVGLAQMFGFSLPEQFYAPLTAQTVTEFSDRWMVTLTSWFREYFFDPILPQNQWKLRPWMVYWLLIGFWHGSGWNFLCLGMLFYSCILLERILLLDRLPIPHTVKRLAMMLVVSLAALLLRCEGLDLFMDYFSNLFGLNHNGFFSATAWMLLREYGIFFLVGVLSCSCFGKRTRHASAMQRLGNLLYPVGMLLLTAACLVVLVRSGPSFPIFYRF